MEGRVGKSQSCNRAVCKYLYSCGNHIHAVLAHLYHKYMFGTPICLTGKAQHLLPSMTGRSVFSPGACVGTSVLSVSIESITVEYDHITTLNA